MSDGQTAEATEQPSGPTPTREQTLALALDRNLAITAGAGTGKTFVLTQRYLRILEHHAGTIGPQHILAVTFTRKAASEMRSRIGRAITKRIHAARRGGDGDAEILWTRHRRRLPDALITTIHGLASEILRSHAIDAGVDPDHTVIDEPTRVRMVEEAIEDTLERLGDKEHDALAHWLTVRGLHGLREILGTLLASPDVLDRWLDTLNEHDDASLLHELARITIPYDQATANDAVARINRTTSALRTETGSALEGKAGRLLDLIHDLVQLDNAPLLEQAQAMHALMEHLSRADGTPYTRMSDARGAVRLWKDAGGTETVDAAIEAIQAILWKLHPDPSRRIAPPGPTDRAALAEGRLVANLADAARERYNEAKRRRGALDFDDLQRQARRLVREHPQVAHSLRRRWRYLLVDEFQDTDETQWDLIRTIAAHDPKAQPEPDIPAEVAFDPAAWGTAEAILTGRPDAQTAEHARGTPAHGAPSPRTDNDGSASGNAAPAGGTGTPTLAPDRLFIVGDEKQSIYGFRGADVSVYKSSRRALRQANQEHGNEPADLDGSATDDERDGLITLADNFRTLPGPVAFVNHLFDHILTPSQGRDTHGDDEAEPGTLRANRETELAPAGTIRVCLTPADPLKCDPGPDSDPLDRPWHEVAFLDGHDLAWRQVAQRILADTAETAPLSVHDPETDAVRPLRHDDIAILLSASTHLAGLVRALREHGIPHTVSGGRGFWDNQEVWDLTNLLTFLSDPSRDIELAGLLRSPLFAWTDDALVTLATHPEGPRRGSLWRKLRTLADNHVDLGVERTPTSLIETRTTLQRWLDDLGTRDIHATLQDILNERRYVATLAAEDRRRQAAENVEKLVETVRGLERRLGPHPVRIVREIEHILDREIAEGEANVPPTEGHGVRIMTVHASKGLEFPYVIVPLMERRFRYGRLGMGWHQGTLDENGPFLVAAQAPDPTTGERTACSLTQLLSRSERARENAEMKRQFYVALTRARDHLVIQGQTKDLASPPGPSERDVAAEAPPSPPAAPGPEAIGPLIDEGKSWLDWTITTLGLRPDHLAAARAQGGQLDLDANGTPYTLDVTPPRLHLDPHGKTGPNSAADDGPRPIEPARIPSAPTIVRLSPSMLEVWRGCPARFRYRVLEGLSEPRLRGPKRRHADHGTTIGSLVHRCFAEGATNDTPIPAPMRNRIRRAARHLGRNVDELERVVTNHVVSGLDALRDLPLADGEHAAIDELPFDVPWSNHLRLVGAMDRVLRDGAGRWHVIDHKTDAVKGDARTHASNAGYDRQVGTYATAVQAATTSKHRTSATLSYTGTGTLVTAEPYDLSDLAESLDRSVDAADHELDARWPRTTDQETCKGCALWDRYGGPCLGADEPDLAGTQGP